MSIIAKHCFSTGWGTWRGTIYPRCSTEEMGSNQIEWLWVCNDPQHVNLRQLSFFCFCFRKQMKLEKLKFSSIFTFPQMIFIICNEEFFVTSNSCNE